MVQDEQGLRFDDRKIFSWLDVSEEEGLVEKIFVNNRDVRFGEVNLNISVGTKMAEYVGGLVLLGGTSKKL